MSKVYEVITSQIVEQLEQGVVPWARPWKVDGLAPSNLLSRRPYRGINVFLLGFRAASTPWWLTFRQAKALGGAIRAGERSTPVIFWRWVDRGGRESAAKDANEGSSAPRSERLPVLRYYSVFNLDQTEGIDPSKIPVADTVAVAPVPTAEEIVADFPVPPTIEHRAQPRAFYRPATDSVTMPPRSAFGRAEGYYSTLFHELTHATGHSKRLARPGFDKNHAAPFGSEPPAAGPASEGPQSAIAGPLSTMTSMFQTEAALVDAFLEGLNEARPWGVQEVTREFFYLRGRTDVVGVISGGSVVAFEAKLKNWRQALHQAYRNTCFAHWSFVLVPPVIAEQAARFIGEFQRRRVGLCTLTDGEVVVVYEPAWVPPLQPWLAAQAASAARSGGSAASS